MNISVFNIKMCNMRRWMKGNIILALNLWEKKNNVAVVDIKVYY